MEEIGTKETILINANYLQIERLQIELPLYVRILGDDLFWDKFYIFKKTFSIHRKCKLEKLWGKFISKILRPKC